MLNKLFLKLKCTKSINSNSYLYEGKTHDYIIEYHTKKSYKIHVYDGYNKLSSAITSNLWEIRDNSTKQGINA